MDDQHSTAKLLKALEQSQRVAPSAAFLQRMEDRALTYAEPRVRYRPQTLLWWALALGLLLAFNTTVVHYFSQTEVDPSESSTFQEWMPVKTILHEED